VIDCAAYFIVGYIFSSRLESMADFNENLNVPKGSSLLSCRFEDLVLCFNEAFFSSAMLVRVSIYIISVGISGTAKRWIKHCMWYK
jgi:hypothetical protein